jgi:hypothetical protein
LIAFGISFIEFVLATFIPIYLGMGVMIFLKQRAKVGLEYLSAFALGILFWFFFDTVNDAIQLGVNEGYAFSFHHAALLLLFILGFLFLALLTGLGASGIERTTKDSSHYSLLVPLLVGLGMGFHGIAEGLAFGGLSSGTQALNVLDAIGGYGGGVSYVLHKLLEATIVAVVLLSATTSQGGSTLKLQDILLVGLAFGGPSAVGEIVGYVVPVDASYFFALGGGAALLVVLFVAKPLFSGSGTRDLSQSRWLGIAFALILGFLCIYAAALFHST